MLSSFKLQQSPLLSAFSSFDEIEMFWDKLLPNIPHNVISNSCAEIFTTLQLNYQNAEVMFDEFEPFHLKCSMYYLSSVYIGKNALEVSKHRAKNTSSKHKEATSVLIDDYFLNTELNNYGFCCAHICGSKLLAVGGFGSSNGVHRRSRYLQSIDLTNGVCSVLSDDIFYGLLLGILNVFCIGNVIFLSERMYATLTPLGENGNVFFLFGGRKSPSHALLTYGLVTISKEMSVELDILSLEEKDEPPPRFRHAACRLSVLGTILVFFCYCLLSHVISPKV